MPQEDDLRRLEPGELPAQLAADRAAGAGDEDGFAGGEHPHLVEIGLDRLPAQQVLDFDLPQRGDGHPPGEDVVHPRHGPGRHPGLHRRANHLPHHLPGRARHGDHDLLDVVLDHELRDLGQRPEHRQVGEPMAVLALVVVHEGDRVEADLRMAQQLLHDHLARGAGADDQRPSGVLQAAALSPTAKRPTASRGSEAEAVGEETIENEDGDGDATGDEAQARQHEPAEEEADEPRQRRGRDESLDLHHPGVAPEPAVQADEPEDRELDGEGEGEKDRGRVGLIGTPLESLEAECKGQQRRADEQCHIRTEQVPVSYIARRPKCSGVAH